MQYPYKTVIKDLNNLIISGLSETTICGETLYLTSIFALKKKKIVKEIIVRSTNYYICSKIL